ncbi:hypothetical protein FJW03_16385 [Mesorhizobium sp. B4-1-4]|nr:hypothetical protein FJW03_16385 [Mesorhizobium sp. B4-1-4]
MGIKLTGEIHRSLGTKDRKLAERTFKEVSLEIEAMWSRCRELLNGGPLEISHKNAVALAGADAVTFLQENEGNPDKVAAPTVWVNSIFRTMRKALGLQGSQSLRLHELEAALAPLKFIDLKKRVAELLPNEPPGPSKAALQTLEYALRAFPSAKSQFRAKAALKSKGLVVSAASKAKLMGQFAKFHGLAWEKLEAYLVPWNKSKLHFVWLLSQEQEFDSWLAGRRTLSF